MVECRLLRSAHLSFCLLHSQYYNYFFAIHHFPLLKLDCIFRCYLHKPNISLLSVFTPTCSCSLLIKV
uniref:Uncharacterized protein n=1 Tax=Anguilla anguilla TaxID=7936 RepID=A0A0E9PWX2_ANGAN